VVLENVPFMLRLRQGRAMSVLIEQLEDLGYTWAYRCVDALAFGRPQRRPRVLIVAARRDDPRSVLLSDDEAAEVETDSRSRDACGFYWTEGNRGLGRAVDAIPPLKGGSKIGIPSPPAIWLPSQRRLVTPDICDAERLQGLPAKWTAVEQMSKGARWRLVGNAVSVPVARWLGMRLQKNSGYRFANDEIVRPAQRWPAAAWGGKGKVFRSTVTDTPVKYIRTSLAEFLRYPTRDLSARATSGFIARLEKSGLNFDLQFLSDAKHHCRHMIAAENALRA